MLLVIYVVCAGFHPGWYRLGLIFSILFGVRSNLCIRSCSGVGRRLTSREAALATGLERGCRGRFTNNFEVVPQTQMLDVPHN